MHSYEYSGQTVHCFSHQAMATVFELHLMEEGSQYAGQAATDIFNELDLIELDLSRYIENGDVARINRLAAGESVVIGEHAFECLKKSIEYYHKTNGIFDIGIGRTIQRWKDQHEKENKDSTILETASILKLDENDHTVTVTGEQLEIDLGGVGKGYAIDCLAEVLEEWGLENFLIHGGRSTSYARCKGDVPPGWPVSISHPENPAHRLAEIQLRNASLSGSGLQKGAHIIDPRFSKPVKNRIATWILADTATETDILSTAFMIMTESEIDLYASGHNAISYLLLAHDGRISGHGIFA